MAQKFTEGRIFFIGFGLICGLLLTEILFLSSPYLRAATGVDSNLIPHPILNHTWRPDSASTHREFVSEGEPPYTHHFNQNGWIHDEDIPPVKPATTYRIFFVGDSFTEGTVAPELSLTGLVRSALETPHNGPRRYEIINTGTSSYSPVLYHLLIKNYLIPLQPNLIVINVDMTDVFDDFVYRASAERDAAGEIIGVPPDTSFSRAFVRMPTGLRRRSRLEGVVGKLGTLSVVMRFAAESLSRATNSTVPIEPDLPTPLDWLTEPWSLRTDAHVHATLEQLRRTIVVARSQQIDIVLTGVPHLGQFLGVQSTTPLIMLKALAQEMDIPFFDSFASIRARLESRDPRSLYYRGDIHFNREGYRLWAAGYSEFLQRLITERALGNEGRRAAREASLLGSLDGELTTPPPHAAVAR